MSDSNPDAPAPRERPRGSRGAPAREGFSGCRRRRGGCLRPALRAVATLLLLAPGGTAFAQSVSAPWTMATPHAPNTFFVANAQRFAQDLEAVSAGRIRIEVQGDGRLHTHEAVEAAVREGAVTIGEFMLSRLASRDPLFGADTLPFLVSGYRKAERLWQVSRAALERRLQERNLVLLFAVPAPPHLLLTRRPLEVDSALRGLGLGMPSDGAGEQHLSLRTLSHRLGAQPVPVGTWMLPDAFEDGRLDAVFLPAPQALGLGAERFAPYVYSVYPWLSKSAVVLNEEVYEALDPALRAALHDAARAAEERGWRMSRRESRRLMERLTERGLSRMRIPDRLWADVVAARRLATVEWTERTGDEGIAVIRAFYATH